MDWQDRHDLVMAANDDKREQSEEREAIAHLIEQRRMYKTSRTRWDDYDVQELGSLMIRSGDLRDEVNRLDPISPPSQVRRLLYDARHYAHLLYETLADLAVMAESQFQEAMAEDGTESES